MTPGCLPVVQAQMLEQAGAQGITPGQLKAARTKLGITDFKAGNVAKWMWPIVETGETNGESTETTA